MRDLEEKGEVDASSLRNSGRSDANYLPLAESDLLYISSCMRKLPHIR
jgi:hypothetical protein